MKKDSNFKSLRFFALLAASLFLVAPVLADLPSPCPPCPHGTQDISLMIMSQEIHDDFTLWSNSRIDYDLYRPSSVTNGGVAIVSDVRQVRTTLVQTAASCKRIKHLFFAAHGAPGQIDVAGSINVSNIDQHFDGLSCAMAPHAEIRMNGCNTGRGCRGEDFMAMMASRLLLKGGSIHANTSDTGAFAFTPSFSTNFDAQILTVDAGLNRPRWDNHPRTMEECRTEAQTALDEIRTVRQRAQDCADPRNYTSDMADVAFDLNLFLDRSRSGNLAVGGRPRFNDPMYEWGAVHLLRGLVNYDYLVEHSDHLPSCPPPRTLPQEVGVASDATAEE